MACDTSQSALGCAADAVAGTLLGGVSKVTASVAVSAWDEICAQFGQAAVSVLNAFADAFVSIPSIDPGSAGIRGPYAMSLGISGVVAAVLMLIQMARTALSGDGSHAAHALLGLGKAAVAFLVTLSVAAASLRAADELSAVIVTKTFGSDQGLKNKLGTLFAAEAVNSGTLLMLMSLVGIVLVLLLWGQLLMRDAAVAVLIATAPIAATGQMSQLTGQWWSHWLTSTIKLIILKPIVALVFCVGFGVFGGAGSSQTVAGAPAGGQTTTGGELTTLLTGMLILLLAVLAWPAVGRFFSFASVHVGGGTGLASVIGAASNAINGRGGGQPIGVPPGAFGVEAEGRTLGAFAARGGGGAGAGGAGAGAGGAALAAVGFGLDLAQRGANSLVSQSEQMAGHAGMQGATPWAQPAGYPRHPQPGLPSRAAPPAAETGPYRPPISRPSASAPRAVGPADAPPEDS